MLGQSFIQCVIEKPLGEENLHLVPSNYIRACIDLKRIISPKDMENVFQVGLVLEKSGRITKQMKINVHMLAVDDNKTFKELLESIAVRAFSIQLSSARIISLSRFTVASSTPIRRLQI